MNRITIGLVGEKGAGKGTFCKLFREVLAENGIITSVDEFKFSDPMRKTLDEYDVDITRANLQDLAYFMNSRRPGAVTERMRKMLEANRAQVSILDGVRWPSDEKFIRTLSGGILLYITARSDVRFGRLGGRDENVGEKGMTREQFDAEEKAETEIFIPEIGIRADWEIKNNSNDREILKKEIRSFVSCRVIPAMNAKD